MARPAHLSKSDPSGSNPSSSNCEYHAHIEESIATIQMQHPLHDSAYFLGRNIYQILLFCTVEEEERYRKSFPELEFVRWHSVSMDVLPHGGSKAKGIEAIIAERGILREDVVAFGDYLNDIEMLKFAGTSVAMGNAPDIVKSAATHVTRNVDDDGIWHGVRIAGLL
ncbi:HAD-IIB family hydrolase [Cohnella faecalis]|uniref:HAD-IIB family hydrolase n=1 Tax=Cohnella faecalis TaxID=2315694 RepID=A0A398CKJ7_9BACL|nr:HAD-IIB family hydrolase [Cohnella faecalis]RIE00417.1 HAD-IIB family hydrolase [Cohnella faecalis]